MAGRKEKYTVDYFPHYVNQKRTMTIVQQKYGNDGYAFWFKLLEVLAQSEHHIYDMNTEENALYFYSRVNVPEDLGKEILELLSRLQAIDSELYENGYIFSNNFIKNIEDAYRKRTSEVLKKEEVTALYSITTGGKGIKGARITQRKEKKSKVKENKEKEEEEKNKEIPTWEEFRDYAISKKPDLNVESMRFKYDAWVLDGWKDGNGKKIINWKSKVNHNIPFWNTVAKKEEPELTADISAEGQESNIKKELGFDFRIDGSHEPKWEKEAEELGITKQEYGDWRLNYGLKNGNYTEEHPVPETKYPEI